jgi:RimJ/RimL family protein N-acetyltransferase
MNITLKPFTKEMVSIIEPWFDDPETKKWLGDRKWIDNIFRMLNEPVGSEFRGQHKIAAYAFLVCDKDKPVGFIDSEISDRWVQYGGEKDGKPVYLNIEEKLTAGMAFVVNPAERGKGYAVSIIKALIVLPEFKEVKIFEAGAEPDNIASQKVLEAAGFTSDYKPDFEDMYYFFYRK